MDRYKKNDAPISQRRASATKPWARLWLTTPVKETAAVAITAAAIAKPRITRSDNSFSACVASVSARYKKYTAARSQMSAIAPSVYASWTLSDERNFTPTIATIDAAIAKYNTPVSASRAFASCASIPFRSADAASCFFSPSTSSGPSSGASPRLSHQLSGQKPNFSMSAAEMSSEGGTRSHPRGGLYVFVPCSQFPQGGGRRDGDERIQRHERDRVVEPPCADTGCGSPLPVRVERRLERLRQIRVFHDQADLAILRCRTERPVHARDEDRVAVHDDAFVVETFDRPARLEQSHLEGETLVPRKPIDPIEHVIVRPRVGLDRGPAPIEEDSHGDPATSRCERGFKERIRRVAPHFVEIERVDRKSPLRGGEEVGDSLGVEGRVRSEDDPRRAWGGRGRSGPWDVGRRRGQRRMCRFVCPYLIVSAT